VEDYRHVNRALWDERGPAHAASPDYNVQQFVDDPTFLSDVVRFDLPLLGDVKGLDGVHLQCHIGTDTLSLARLGAHMTGVDFSAASLAEARALADAVSAEIRFVEAEVYDATEVLGREQFDLVYTGVGALGWLPEIRRWGALVADLLRPGGRFFMREGHPVMWALDDSRDDQLLVLEEPYFERAEPTVWDEGGTYVETDAVFTQTRSLEWNHGMGEIVTALLDAGLTISGLVEHDSLPWNGLTGKMERIGGGEWRLVDRPWRLPHSYTLLAVK
jgi:SAM-dependent methyltransferase